MSDRGESRYGGEGQWWRGNNDRTGAISANNGIHPLIFWIDGDQDVYWDNIRLVLSVIEVEIDIKPCSDPNAINPKDDTLIPVGIKHTDDFNPAERVDVGTLRFGAPDVVENGGGSSPAHDGHVEDIVPCEGDGKDDLVLHFPTENTGFNGDEDTGRLEGETKDGTPLFGTDSVKLVGQ